MYSSSLPESYIFYPAFFFILSLALTIIESISFVKQSNYMIAEVIIRIKLHLNLGILIVRQRDFVGAFSNTNLPELLVQIELIYRKLNDGCLVVCCDNGIKHDSSLLYDAKIGIYFIYLLPNSSNDRYAHCVTCHLIKVTIL